MHCYYERSLGIRHKIYSLTLSRAIRGKLPLPARRSVIAAVAIAALATLTGSSASAQAFGTIAAPEAPSQAAAAAVPAVSVPSFRFTGLVDHAASGVGLRNKGAGVIRLRGVPVTAQAEAGILYFGIICNGPCPFSQVVNFQGKPVTAINIATATQPCWFGTEYGAYSVGVTPLLSNPINDDYVVSGVPSNLTNGSDPWATPGSAPLAEGASLVVVYSDPSLSPGIVYVHDGAVFFAATVDIDNPVSPPLPGSSRKFTAIGADGQVGTSTAAAPTISGEKTLIGPTGGSLTQISGPNSTQNQDSDWNGHDGVPLNQLWDTNTHSFIGILPAGTTSYRVEYQSFGDCMDWTAHVLTAR
jgi:hypothetical protein